MRSQLAVFKRPAEPGEDQLGFAYPPFSILPILPLLFLPFDWASAVWLALLILCWVGAVFWVTRKSPLWPGLLVAAFYPVFFGLILGNFVSLTAALLAVLVGVYLFDQRPSGLIQALAGVAAAYLLVKPQFSWLYVLILLLFGLPQAPVAIFSLRRGRVGLFRPGLFRDLADLAARMAGRGQPLRGLQPDLADPGRGAARFPARGLGPQAGHACAGVLYGFYHLFSFSLVVWPPANPGLAGLGRPGRLPGTPPREILRTPGVPRPPAGVGLPPSRQVVDCGAGLVAGQPGYLLDRFCPVAQPAGAQRRDRVAGCGVRGLGRLAVAAPSG